MPPSFELASLVDAALAEDVGDGDWTTLWTVPADAHGRARVVAKATGVLAGTAPAAATFARLDPAVRLQPARADGDRLAPGDLVATLDGPVRALLTGERTALNFLQRLSGIASLTRRFVDAVHGTSARILDTRKTTPGWRALEKAAVCAGGGVNHRGGLHDMVLIKENHIAAAGGLAEAVRRVRERNERGLEIEVEVRSLDELATALALEVERVLLDNMETPTLRAAVAMTRGHAGPRPLLEASGNMSLERVPAVAATGIDFISVGALTHSAPALDLTLLIES
jgi:nicotinate-nucleotide pyrophosphorylase (carboxylating)